METKICTKCGKELPLSDFHWRDKAKGTRRSECKNCHNKAMNERNAANRQLIHKLKQSQCCEKCGEKRWYVLDYHHIEPSKKTDTIAKLMVHSNSNTVVEEVQKCILLCRNCHAEFHYLNETTGITLEEYLNQ